MTTTVAIYTRLSKDESGTQTATKRQEQACRAFAALREWEVDGAYEDVDLSAFKKGVVRPSYEALLEAIQERRVAGVVVWKLDRLVRRPAEFERFWAVCEANGAILASATEPIDTSTDLGVALVRILVSFAGLESATLGLRIRAKLNEQAKAGAPPSIVGFGFKRNPFRVVPRQAALIRDAAERVLSGESLRSIAAEWNRKGVRTNRGNAWSYSTVKNVLTSRRLAGDRIHMGEVVATDCWPAILDRSTSERLRVMLTAPSKQENANFRRHLLTGLVFCGRCDAALYTTSKGGVLAYRCPSPPKGCGKLQINCASLDQYVLEAACQHLDNGVKFGYVPIDRAHLDVESVTEEFEEQKIRLKELGDDYYVHHLLTQKEYRHYRSVVLEQVKTTVSESGARAPHSTVVLSASLFMARWEMLDVRERRAQLDRHISRITIRPARRREFDPDRVEIKWYRDVRSKRPHCHQD